MDTYKQLMKQKYQEKIDRLVQKNKRIAMKISNLEKKLQDGTYYMEDDSPTYNSQLDGHSVTNTNDKERIVNDMKNDLPPRIYNTYIKKLDSVFYHADNVRNIYEEAGLECPKWYSEKYREYLA